MTLRQSRSSLLRRKLFRFELLESRQLLAGDIFVDDFNRSDGPIGNGWSDFYMGNGIPFEIRDGKAVNPNTNLGANASSAAGIYRTFPVDDRLTVSGTVHESMAASGNGSYFAAGVFVGSDGQQLSGFGVVFGRSGTDWNDSQIQIVDDGVVLARMYSPFQFMDSLQFEFSFDSNGKVAGHIIEGNRIFQFQSQHAISAFNGSEVMLWSSPRDDRGRPGPLPRIDDVRFESTSFTSQFFDDFNRPDGPIENGWSTFVPGNGIPFEVRNGFAVNPNSNIGDRGVSAAGIHRTIELGDATIVSGTLHEWNGLGGEGSRFEAGAFVGSDGGQNSGFGVVFGRSASNYNNSAAYIVDDGVVLATINSPFQFQHVVQFEFKLSRSGAVSGKITEGSNLFQFQSQHQITPYNGNEAMFWTSPRDDRRPNNGPLPKFDDIRIESQRSGLFSADNTTISLWRMNGNRGEADKSRTEVNHLRFDAMEVNSPSNATGLDGNPNGAYQLGGNSYLQVPNIVGVNYGQHSTVEALVYYSSNNQIQTIYADWDWHPSKHLLFFTDESGYLKGQVGTSSSGPAVVASSTELLIPGSWYYVAMTHKVGETVKVYVNGELAGESEEVLPSFNAGTSTWDNAQIGAHNYHGAIESPWLGKIDEVMISNLAKNENQFQATFESFAHFILPDLAVSNARFFDANEDTILFDLQSVGYTGDVEVALVRSDNLRWDADDTLLQSKTITISQDGTLADLFALSISDQILDETKPFYLVVVDPENGNGGLIAESNEGNNTRSILKDENYLFIDFGTRYQIDPMSNRGVVSGTIGDFHTRVNTRELTGYFEEATSNTILSFSNFLSAITNYPIQHDLLASEVVDLTSEIFAPFDLRIVTVAMSSLSEMEELQTVSARLTKHPTYTIVGSSPSIPFQSNYIGLLGVAARVDVRDSAPYYNQFTDTVLVFADAVAIKSASWQYTNSELAFFLAKVIAHEVGHALGVPHVARATDRGFKTYSAQTVMAPHPEVVHEGRINYFAQYPIPLNEPDAFPFPCFIDGKVSQFAVLAEALGLSETAPVYVFGTGRADNIEITRTDQDTISVRIVPTNILGLSDEAFEFQLEFGSGLFVYSGDGNDVIELLNFDSLNNLVVNGGQDTDELKVFGTQGNESLEISFSNSSFWDIDSLESVEISLEAGDDTLVFGQSDYEPIVIVRGGIGNDTIDFTGYRKGGVAYGDAGDDRLIGWFFNDYLNGGSGSDTLFAGLGDDVLEGGADNDNVYGEGGNDRLLGGAGNDYLNGGGDNDRLDGGSGVDTLFGEAGDDYLFGGIDFDFDQLWGGIGVDTFYTFTGDLINDFEVGIDKKDRGSRGGR